MKSRPKVFSSFLPTAQGLKEGPRSSSVSTVALLATYGSRPTVHGPPAPNYLFRWDRLLFHRSSLTLFLFYRWRWGRIHSMWEQSLTIKSHPRYHAY